jgi:putative membrane protein
MSGDDLPTLNAVLNTTSAVLLIAGYAAIRSRRVTLHKTCMLSAFCVSTAFLVSYVYYHFAVKPTYFTQRASDAPRWLARLYGMILASHVILAVPAVVLALITIWLALRGNFQRHVRIARWTLPIWLYVSITGVVVYWMLYRLYP